MKSTLVAALVLVSSSSSFAGLNCAKPMHAMEFAKCAFVEAINGKSNPDVETAKALLAAQGFSEVNLGEEPGAVFVRGNQDRYTYLVTTDVGSTGREFKSIGMIISSKVDSHSANPEVRIEKVLTSDSL